MDDKDDCAGGSCCGSGSKDLGRRQFLKSAGVGFLSTTLAGSLTGAMAGPFSAEDTKSGHLIPEDKKLSPEWLRSLRERGAKEVFKGKSLDTIGMPCCGIGTGQLYLCGDGTLGCGQIFNDAQSNWVAESFATFAHRGISKPFDNGFAVIIKTRDGIPMLKTLDRNGFADVSFRGEYPIGTIRYEEAGCPVNVQMEAFSPFIPLNAKDSALPATLFHITIENTSSDTVEAGVLGWLENAVCSAYAREYDFKRRTQYATRDGHRICLHSAEESPPEEAPQSRPTILFESFDGPDYGHWQVGGGAFGKGPTPASPPNPNGASGFEGEGYAGSFGGGEGPQGTLTSPVFKIERRHINFLIAGGGHLAKTCINLLVDGKVVRTSLGKNSKDLAWRSWPVQEWEGKDARIVILDKMSLGFGLIAIDQIEFADTPRRSKPDPITTATDYGTMALACSEPAPQDAAILGPIPPGRPLDSFVTADTEVYGSSGTRRGLLYSATIALAPGEKHSFTYALAWHFPNQIIGDQFVVTPWNSPPQRVGHDYEDRFGSAAEVLAYVFQDHERLTRDTRLWRDLYYDSSLPFWLLDRLHSTVSCLATGTCQWWKGGRFWAYEGVACCHGTCTHVWNYAHAHARLFPQLARGVSEMQDFCPRENGGGYNPGTGLVGFRGDDAYSADGQCGTILKAYREHLMSSNDSFLKRNWPSIKKAVEFSISHDPDLDGLIEDIQPNTYDIDYYGANTFVGSLYLAALRAAEEMAGEIGDLDFAKRAGAIRERGSSLTHQRLWNGEYYIQEVDLDKYPKDQYKDGCLSDQLFGQGWAHQLGLGYLYPPQNVQKALDAIWRYNWAPDVAPYNTVHKPFRWFVKPGQAGLITCTWPKGDYLDEGTRYREEVWTGIEYQVAGHMIAEGKVTEGLAICRAVHDRYHPDFFNPYNEVECGDHYARAMASWGVFIALAGFQYHGPKGWLTFIPRISPESFRAAFTAAEGWGSLQQTRIGVEQRNTIDLRWGKLRLTQLTVEAGRRTSSAKIALNNDPIAATSIIRDGQISFRFEKEVLLQAGQKLELLLHF